MFRLKGFLILAAILLIAGCAQSDNPVLERQKELALNSPEILIGVAWPFAARNDGFREGLDLALEEINRQGVLGGKIKLMPLDDQESVTTGLSVARTFADDAGMTAVIGHRGSSVAVPASKVYENAGLLMLAPTSTSPKLTEGTAKLVFRMIPSDLQLGKQMADYAKAKGYTHVAIYYENDEYGRGLANSFEDSALANQLQIIDRVADYKDVADLKRLIGNWKLLDCDAVFVAKSMPEGAEFIRQLRAAGLEVPVLGGDGLDSPELPVVAAGAAEGAVVASVFNPRDKRDIVQSFVRNYKEKYGEEPMKYAAQAYDSLYLLSQAIEAAGSRQPAAIAAALRKQASWPGVSGTRLFDPSGDVQGMPIVLKQVVHGQFEYLN
jgi:branched-chain amino acid transport system substrate-binding protein